MFGFSRKARYREEIKSLLLNVYPTESKHVSDFVDDFAHLIEFSRKNNFEPTQAALGLIRLSCKSLIDGSGQGEFEKYKFFIATLCERLIEAAQIGGLTGLRDDFEHLKQVVSPNSEVTIGQHLKNHNAILSEIDARLK
jgi:hypothetical protein